ncbi:MAG: hypothetical protein WA821_07920 [Anaerolineales bacterium]
MRQIEPSPPDAGPEKAPLTTPQIIEIGVGFVAWYVINGLIWWGGTSNYRFFLAIFTLPGNLIALLICAIVPRLRKVALGILIAIALNLVITLVLGMLTNALCFVPFFNK